jgi:hypothetical protein
MLLVAALSVSLTLAQLRPATNGWILAVVATALNLMLPPRAWRFVVYGALVGMVVMLVAMVVDVRLRTGIPVARNYREGAEIAAITNVWRPYILPFGAFVGGAIGFLLLNTTRTPMTISESDPEQSQ